MMRRIATILLVVLHLSSGAKLTRELSVISSEDDAVIVTNNEKRDTENPETRLFTDNAELNAGVAGLLVGGGVALLATHLISENDKKNKCKHHYVKRDADEPTGRFFGGGNDYDCPPDYGYGPPKQGYGPPPKQGYGPPPPHHGYAPPHQGYAPAPHAGYAPSPHAGYAPAPVHYRPPPTYHPTPAYNPTPSYQTPRPTYNRPDYRPPSRYEEPNRRPSYQDNNRRPSYNKDDDYRRPSYNDQNRRPSYQNGGDRYQSNRYENPPYRDDYRAPNRSFGFDKDAKTPVFVDNEKDQVAFHPRTLAQNDDVEGEDDKEETRSSRVRFAED